jgi:hypothetical protein
MAVLMDIDDIIEAVQQGQVQITDHADEEAQDDDLGFEDIFFSVCGGEIIEQYPMQKTSPRCLIFGKAPQGEPIHSVWAYDHRIGVAILITVYRPDPNRWIDWCIRK